VIGILFLYITYFHFYSLNEFTFSNVYIITPKDILCRSSSERDMLFTNLRGSVILIVILVIIVIIVIGFFIKRSIGRKGTNLIGGSSPKELASKQNCNTDNYGYICSGNSCAYTSADDEATGQYGCCNSTGWETYLGRDYCTNMSDGTSCLSDNMCANGKCGIADASNKFKYMCCPSGDYTYVYNFRYCTQRPTGTPCLVDAVCANGTCSPYTDGYGTCN